MRRTVVSAVTLALATTCLAAAPASASAAGPDAAQAASPAAWAAAAGDGTGHGWEPAPSTPWDVPAGARCDFPVHSEPLVDEVVRRVLTTHPDGSPKRVAYKGDLVVRLTNTDTGAFYDADISGSALVEYRTDGSQFWWVLGPVLVGSAEDGGTMPRGLYVVDGVYTLDISSDGYKSLRLVRGTTTDLCALID